MTAVGFRNSSYTRRILNTHIRVSKVRLWRVWDAVVAENSANPQEREWLGSGARHGVSEQKIILSLNHNEVAGPDSALGAVVPRAK